MLAPSAETICIYMLDFSATNWQWRAVPQFVGVIFNEVGRLNKEQQLPKKKRKTMSIVKFKAIWT